MLQLLLFLACATETSSTLGGINPTKGSVGSPVQISGSDFQEGEIILIGAVPLDHQVLESASRITGEVPSGIAGVVDVELKRKFGSMKLQRAFEVVAHEVQACEEGVVTIGQLMSKEQEMVVERRWTGGHSETVGLKWKDIEAVEFERRPLPGGKTCTGFFLNSRKGGRVLFDDSTTADLEENARSVAAIVGKPLLGVPDAAEQ